MNTLNSYDAPIDNPNNDLLGMQQYAEALARYIKGETPPYIEPPFTMGVYGEWGEGKSSFVKLIRHYLGNESTFHFVEFSAWPHTTSDELWRALVLKIARSLYHVQEKEPQLLEEPNTSGFVANLVGFLRRDALVLRPKPPETDADAKYAALARRLDKTTSSISRSGSQATQIDQTSILALIGAALDAAGTISPLLGLLRGFFGLNTNVSLAQTMSHERNEATRDAIASVEQFRSVFKLLVETASNQRPVYVFVDDLDRCAPDVALDILEAIKIFLGEARCIFIVAADERLIGQGLRLRYHQLIERIPDQETQEYFARKGQEYFEKIIQLGVRVPPRDEQLLHTFIAAQFSCWAAASDILQSVVNDNPRRLKQYCNWLMYVRMVYDMQQGKRA
jgi:hypothetical protein